MDITGDDIIRKCECKHVFHVWSDFLLLLELFSVSSPP